MEFCHVFSLLSIFSRGDKGIWLIKTKDSNIWQYSFHCFRNYKTIIFKQTNIRKILKRYLSYNTSNLVPIFALRGTGKLL